MSVAEQIAIDVQSLPEPAQAEVLDFVQFLKTKAGVENTDWSTMSLTQAMNGMGDEAALYSENDIKEHFK